MLILILLVLDIDVAYTAMVMRVVFMRITRALYKCIYKIYCFVTILCSRLRMIIRNILKGLKIVSAEIYLLNITQI